MTYMGDLIALLLTEETLILHGAQGRRLMTVNRTSPATLEDEDQKYWLVTDYQQNPSGVNHTADSPQGAAALVLDHCGARSIPVRRMLARRAYDRLFPIGPSLSWRPPPLQDWRSPAPTGRAPAPLPEGRSPRQRGTHWRH